MGISPMFAPGQATESVTPDAADDQDRLLNLFWNRAELKKEFSNLQHDRDHLIEKLKEQEKATDKVRRELRELELLLANPDDGYRAIVYFQLRELWGGCHEKLARFAEELKKQQQDRERKRQIMQFNQERQKRLKDVSGRIVSVKAEADEMKRLLAGIVAERDGLTGFWNYFKRRAMQQSIDEHKDKLAAIRARIEELFDRRIKIESEPWPDYPGLAIAGKRAINLALIALAQQLYVQLTDNKIATHARGAHLKKVKDVGYGSRSDCEYMMKAILEVTALLAAGSSSADELRARTEMLKKQVEYRNERDTVPDAATLSKLVTTVPGFDPRRAVASVPADVNVLTDDYWDLGKLLLK